jgi:hypothetical protein
MALVNLTPEFIDLLTYTAVVSGAHIRAAAPGTWSAWQVVEVLCEDDTRWCDIEGKWEYYYTENFALALRSEVAELQKLIELDEVQDALEGHRLR